MSATTRKVPGFDYLYRRKRGCEVRLQASMHHSGRRFRAAFSGTLLAASALTVPSVANAATDREADLLVRLERLETEMRQLRADLAAAKAAQADTAAQVVVATDASKEATTKVAALAATPQPDGFRAGNTSVKLGGFLKMVASNSKFSEGEVATNSLGRDFYLPHAIPVGSGPSQNVEDFAAKQSRLWLNLASDVAGHSVKGYLEVDFQTAPGTQGSQRTTNGYNLALRRAFVQVDRWTLGQEWSTFMYPAALPESTDFVGVTEGTVFVRQPLVRYTMPASRDVQLQFAVEEPESGTATAGIAGVIENGDDRVPDFVVRAIVTGKPGELALAGIVRQVRVDNAGIGDTSFGWGVTAAGKLILNADKSSDFRAMVTYGHNLSRYIGLNFAPDSVYVAETNSLEDVNVFAGFAALRIAVAPQVRVNVMGSYQNVDYANALALSSIAGFNKRAWSGAANLFYSPVSNVDVGVEYRHGNRKVVSGADGDLDRIEFAAKYSF